MNTEVLLKYSCRYFSGATIDSKLVHALLSYTVTPSVPRYKVFEFELEGLDFRCLRVMQAFSCPRYRHSLY